MERTWMPIAAGILNIISGAARLVGGIIILILGWLGDGFFSFLWFGMPGIPVIPSALLSIVAIPVIVLGILAIVGGICALQRRAWGLALTGAISGAFLSWFLGIPAIILTALSKKEFA